MTSEKDFQVQFSRWAKSNVHENGAFELKFVKGNSLPFNHVLDHQIANLLSVKHRSLVYKIPDVGWDLKPFDTMVLSGANAYIVVMFHEKRRERKFYAIDIDEFLRHIKESTRKSLTRSEAESLCAFVGVLA